MTPEPTTLHVPFGNGEIAVRDYGGSGPMVLLVHAFGMCAMNWERVGPRVAQQCRVLAIDLPGHGQSSADLTHPFDCYRSVCTVARALGGQVLLVGHDHGSYVTAGAVTAEPELFTAGVAIGGSLARTEEEQQELSDFAASDFFADQLRERFKFGVRGRGEEEAKALVESVVSASSADWVTYDLEGLRDELTYSIFYLPDGTWIHHPDPSALTIMGQFPSDSPQFPIDRLAPTYPRPMWLVQLSDGYDAYLAEREEILAEDYPILRIVRLTSGQWPQYTAIEELTRVITSIAHDPTGRAVGLDVA